MHTYRKTSPKSTPASIAIAPWMSSTSKMSNEKQPRTYALTHNDREKYTNNSYPVMRSQFNFTDQTRSDAAGSRYLAVLVFFITEVTAGSKKIYHTTNWISKLIHGKIGCQ